MSSFEKALVYHCSPTLCGLKPANLLSLSKDEYPHLPQLAAAYARLLEDKGIRLTILCSCGCRWLLLVYHQSMLAAQLKQPAVVRLLAQAGYPVEAPFSLEQLLRCLSRRLRQSEGFPHEIGVFLGYPLDFAAIKAKAASCAAIGRCTATWTMQNGALPPLTAAAMHCTPACCPAPLWNSWCPLPNLLPE